MHELLIRTNIALFKGEYAEANRLLSAYRAEQPGDTPDASLILWLEAQAQPDQERRIDCLRKLLETAGPGDRYAVMARDYLEEIDAHTRRRNGGFRLPRAARYVVQAVLFVALGVMLAVLGSALVEQGRGAAAEVVIVTPTPAPGEPTAVPALPDHSQQLVSEDYQARYSGGILQLRAVEDSSERVIDTRTEQLISPVPGARFYALYAAFECRASICEAPPQADLALRTDGGDVLPLREGTALYGQGAMQPIALGRTTEGWLVFELPVTFRPETLIITPLLADGTAGEPVTLSLPPGS